MATQNDKFLRGKILVAMPKLDDDCFRQSVIYLCSHGKEGAMGFMINKKLKDFSLSDLAVPFPVQNFSNLNQIYLYHGGPVEKIRGFILHSAEYQKPDTYQVNTQIALSSNLDVLTDIVYGIGPKENLVALGYCAWEPAQLEKELMQNDWLVTDASTDLLFHTNDELKWERAMDETNIDLDRFLPCTGHA
ncbi:MAG: YqgE/AlgH family protein [Alphaproteobacteria bacterium]|nr:YqgE/AlgH family protein [Alphaproteobacteria bacterium]